MWLRSGEWVGKDGRDLCFWFRALSSNELEAFQATESSGGWNADILWYVQKTWATFCKNRQVEVTIQHNLVA
jgi:hypothetical protein